MVSDIGAKVGIFSVELVCNLEDPEGLPVDANLIEIAKTFGDRVQRRRKREDSDDYASFLRVFVPRPFAIVTVTEDGRVCTKVASSIVSAKTAIGLVCNCIQEAIPGVISSPLRIKKILYLIRTGYEKEDTRTGIVDAVLGAEEEGRLEVTSPDSPLLAGQLAVSPLWRGSEGVVFYVHKKQSFASHRVIMRYEPPYHCRHDLSLVEEQVLANAGKLCMILRDRRCCF